MRLLATEKFKFEGPDPPLNPSIVEEVEAPIEDVKASGGKGKKAEEPPPEVQKTPEELAEEKMFDDFSEEFMKKLAMVKQDLTEYRKLSDLQTSGIKKVALWPKKYTKAELVQMKKDEEERLKREAEEEEKKRKEEEEAASLSKGPGKSKGPTSKTQPSRATASRGGPPSTSHSARSARTKQTEANRKKIVSMDDEKKKWDF